MSRLYETSLHLSKVMLHLTTSGYGSKLLLGFQSHYTGLALMSLAGLFFPNLPLGSKVI